MSQDLYLKASGFDIKFGTPNVVDAFVGTEGAIADTVFIELDPWSI